MALAGPTVNNAETSAPSSIARNEPGSAPTPGAGSAKVTAKAGVALAVWVPSAGAVIWTVGATLSRVTVRTWLTLWPTPSVTVRNFDRLAVISVV